MSEIQPFYPVTVVTIERIERDELYAKWGPYADDSSYEGISFILPIHDQTAEGQHAFDEWIENPFAERFCDCDTHFYTPEVLREYSLWCKYFTPFHISYYDYNYWTDKETAHLAAIYCARDYGAGCKIKYAVVREHLAFPSIFPVSEEDRERLLARTTDIFRYSGDDDNCVMLSEQEIKDDELATAIYQHFALDRRCIEHINET